MKVVKMTDKQQKLLDALFTDEVKGDLRKAMDVAGYSKATPVSVATAPIRDKIADKVKEFLASEAAVEASWVMRSALNPKTPEDLLGLRERISAAKDLMDRAGLGAAQRVEVDAKNPLFILPAKDNA